jgi:hypothetical protein
VTARRLLAAVGTAAAVAAAGGALFVPRRPSSREVAAPAPARDLPPDAFPAGSPVREVRVAVPPGILARAAGARALEHAPVCTPAPSRPPEACAPPRDSVEIEWDVAPERQ